MTTEGQAARPACRRACWYIERWIQVTRVEIGHPEGYLEAFANLYSDIAKAVVARLCRKALDQVDRAFPTVEDGVKGLAFVEAAVRSSASHRWQPLESPAI